MYFKQCVLPATWQASSMLLHVRLHPFSPLRHCSLKYVQSVVWEADSFSEHSPIASIATVAEQQKQVCHIAVIYLRSKLLMLKSIITENKM